MTFFQAGTYTCYAYNDLGKAASSVEIVVTHVPTTRLRKDTSENGQLITLRCIVTAVPAANITYFWYHDSAPIPVADSATYLVPAGAKGAYACAARNAVGMSERSGIKVGGPVALVAGTDYTYAIFGVSAVITVFAAILFGIIICRAYAVVGKYNLGAHHGANGHGGGHAQFIRNGGHGANNGEVNHVVSAGANGNGVSLYAATSPHVTFAENEEYCTDNGHTATLLLGGKPRKQIQVKSPTIEVKFDEIQPEPMPNNPVREMARTFELKNVRAPRELWLV